MGDVSSSLISVEIKCIINEIIGKSVNSLRIFLLDVFATLCTDTVVANMWRASSAIFIIPMKRGG